MWWSEGRPTEGGRQVVVRRGPDGAIADVLPAPWNARTRVHEYGGVSWLPTPAGLVFCEFTDQRLWLLPAGASEPIPLTPEPDEPAALRYAELTWSWVTSCGAFASAAAASASTGCSSRSPSTARWRCAT